MRIDPLRCIVRHRMTCHSEACKHWDADVGTSLRITYGIFCYSMVVRLKVMSVIFLCSYSRCGGKKNSKLDALQAMRMARQTTRTARRATRTTRPATRTAARQTTRTVKQPTGPERSKQDTKTCNNHNKLPRTPRQAAGITKVAMKIIDSILPCRPASSR